MKTLLRLLILTILAVLIAFVLAKLSTFGWRFSTTPKVTATKDDEVLAELLKYHVYKLSQKIGDRSVFTSENLEESAQYIVDQLKSYGYNPEFQTYVVSDKTVKNILAFKRGSSKQEETVLVGAHYDTAANPGADDNASGVAALLELARLLTAEKIGRNVVFAAFVNEEAPFFQTENMGSWVYAKNARSKEEKIKGAVILESIGYYSDKPNSQRYQPFFGMFYSNKGNFLGVVGNLRSKRLVEEVVTGFKSESRFPIESITTFDFITGVNFSDNWSFWKEGYSAVMITDTAFYRNPHYHKASDTSEKLDYENLAQVVKGLNRVLIELAK